jgi:hypothetical protein
MASDNGYGVPDSIVGLVGIEVGHVDMCDDEVPHLVAELNAIDVVLKFYVSFLVYEFGINRALILSTKPCAVNTATISIASRAFPSYTIPPNNCKKLNLYQSPMSRIEIFKPVCSGLPP